MTSQGHPPPSFVALLRAATWSSPKATVRAELHQIGLTDALELTALIALKDPRRHTRAGARWLRRYLETVDGPMFSCPSTGVRGLLVCCCSLRSRSGLLEGGIEGVPHRGDDTGFAPRVTSRFED